ncbi:MAG: protein kinase [Anaerolineales bacterium]|nr:MAG: protein kinase [Anaerolineales bacterium]
MSFNAGENIGPYQIIEQLGQGGMATVYKAYHAALDRYVALKVLHTAFHEDHTFTARFQREARVVARLEHPNIVPVYDFAEHQSRPYLVMKYIEGDTLKARLGQGELTSGEIEQVVNSVGSALGYAHEQGILHRDIKPSNVLLSTDGVMYIADFGLARIAQAGESTLSSDSIMGTPQYISPEQAMGKKELDAGTDIYSFAVMLYEMVVGQVPFSADTPFSIIHDHIYTPLPLPMDINPKVPESVQRVLLKALAKERKDRYATVAEMVNAFKDAWTEAGVPMQGTSITIRPAKLKSDEKKQGGEPAAGTVAAKRTARKRSPWMWVGMGMIAVLCCGVGLIGFRGNIRSFLGRPTAVVQATLPDVPNTQLPPTMVGNEAPQVAAAREQVGRNPSDPNAHLQLALALWDVNEVPPAMQELAQAANLAGPTNKDFFLSAALEFRQREAWVPAAGMYLRLAQIYRGEDSIPLEVHEGLNEAVYKSAGQKDMPTYVFFDRIDNVSLPLGYIARGRYALYHGEAADAKLQISNIEKVKPDMYEVFLLKAEFEMKVGSRTQARNILLSLSADLGAPEWVRLMAGEFLKTIE